MKKLLFILLFPTGIFAMFPQDHEFAKLKADQAVFQGRSQKHHGQLKNLVERSKIAKAKLAEYLRGLPTEVSKDLVKKSKVMTREELRAKLAEIEKIRQLGRQATTTRETNFYVVLNNLIKQPNRSIIARHTNDMPQQLSIEKSVLLD